MFAAPHQPTIPPEVAGRRRLQPQHEVRQEPVEGVARDVGPAAALDPTQQEPTADACDQPRHELVGRQAEQGRAHQGGGLVDGPEQPALRVVETARNGVARGLAHQTIAVPTRPVTIPVPAPAAMPTPDRAHELHGVEAQHRAHQRGADGEGRGELASGAADDVLHRLERRIEGVVSGRQRNLRHGQHGGGRDERQAGRVHLSCPARHRPAPFGAVPSSMVEARRRPCAQSSRSLRR